MANQLLFLLTLELLLPLLFPPALLLALLLLSFLPAASGSLSVAIHVVLTLHPLTLRLDTNL